MIRRGTVIIGDSTRAMSQAARPRLTCVLKKLRCHSNVKTFRKCKRSSGLPAEINEPQLRRLNRGLRPACHLERAKDGRDVGLHRAFGKTQLAADDLVGCTSGNQLQHLGLALAEAERFNRQRRPPTCSRQGDFVASGTRQDLGWKVPSTGKHQAQRVQHHRV
jgi:hypothetical protein